MATMSKRTDQPLVKRVAGVSPDVLAKYATEDQSLSALQEYRILPRTKIIQGMSSQELKKNFGLGSVIIRPGDAVLWRDGMPPFGFVPQFFYTEFSKFSDRRDKEAKRVVLENTFDPTSEIAKRARDPKLRFEYYPGQENKPEKDKWVYRWVEHQRYAGVVYGEHSLAGTPIVVSFEKGEFGQGKAYASAIMLRKKKIEFPDPNDPDTKLSKNIAVPLWMQVWGFRGGHRQMGDNQWEGLDFVTMEQTEILTHEVEEFHEAHLSLRKAHEARRIIVDGEEHDEGDPAETAPADPNAPKF